MKSKDNIKNIIITSFMGIGNTINLIPLAEYFSKRNFKVYFLLHNKIAFEVLKKNKYVEKSFLIPKEKSLIKNLKFSLNLRKKINPKETFFIITYPYGGRREQFISKIFNAKKNLTIKKYINTHDVQTNLSSFMENPKYVRPKIFFSKEEEEFSKKFLKNKVSKRDNILAIHPGCSFNNPQKRLSKEKYLEIVMKEVEKNKKIFLFFGPDEIEMKPFFEKKLSNYLNKKVFCITEKDIRKSAILMKRCDEYLGNDSGLMHIAEAVGVRKIKAFFIVDLDIAHRNFPLGKKENAII